MHREPQKMPWWRSYAERLDATITRTALAVALGKTPVVTKDVPVSW